MTVTEGDCIMGCEAGSTSRGYQFKIDKENFGRMVRLENTGYDLDDLQRWFLLGN